MRKKISIQFYFENIGDHIIVTNSWNFPKIKFLYDGHACHTVEIDTIIGDILVPLYFNWVVIAVRRYLKNPSTLVFPPTGLTYHVSESFHTWQNTE